MIKRAIAAIAIFFVPMLVNMLIGMVGDAGAKEGSFVNCWNDSGKNANA